jgi:hypothetical protein
MTAEREFEIGGQHIAQCAGEHELLARWQESASTAVAVLAALRAGDPVWVMDDSGSDGWAGRVTEVHLDSLAVEYAGDTEIFRLPDGRLGARYLVIRDGDARQEPGS